VTLAGSAHTGWPTTAAEARVVDRGRGEVEVEPVLGPRNNDRFPTYARFDLKARWALTLARSRLWWTLDVANLTDRRNACCVDDFVLESHPDGTHAFRALYSPWLGITPSFSVLWELSRDGPDRRAPERRIVRPPPLPRTGADLGAGRRSW
jgi:hypothetical protein